MRIKWIAAASVALAAAASFPPPAQARNCRQLMDDFMEAQGISGMDRLVLMQKVTPYAGLPQGRYTVGVEKAKPFKLNYGVDTPPKGSKEQRWFFEFSQPPMRQSVLRFKVENGHCVATGFEFQSRGLVDVARCPANAPLKAPAQYDPFREACDLVRAYRVAGPAPTVVPAEGAAESAAESAGAR